MKEEIKKNVETTENTSPKEEELEKALDSLIDTYMTEEDTTETVEKAEKEEKKDKKKKGKYFDDINSDDAAKKERPTEASGGKDVIKAGNCDHGLLPELCKSCQDIEKAKKAKKIKEEEIVEEKKDEEGEELEKEKKAKSCKKSETETTETVEKTDTETAKTEKTDTETAKTEETVEKSATDEVFELTEDEFNLVKKFRMEKSKIEEKEKEEEFKKSVQDVINEPINEIKAQIEELKKVLSRPANTRKSLTGVEPIEKSYDTEKLSKAEALDILEKAAKEDVIKADSVMEYEQSNFIADPIERKKAFDLLNKSKK